MKKIIAGLIYLVVFAIDSVGQGGVVADTSLAPEARYSYYYAEGLREKMLGNNDMAFSYFTKCIELLPALGSAYYELGLLYTDKKDYSAAAGYARNAWKRDQMNKWYGMLLVDNLMQLGLPMECVPVYQQLQRIEPDSEEFVTGEIEMLILAKKEKEALRKLDKLPRQGEIARWGVIRKRDILFSGNQYDKATKVLLDWLKRNPEDFEIRGILAEALASQGEKEKAAEQYAILKEQNPDNPAVNFSLGQFYFQIGRKDEALVEFLNGFRSPEVNPSIKIDIVKSFISKQEQQEKLDEQVIKLIEVLYLTDKGNQQVDELYANFLYSEERLSEAEPIFRQIVKNNPGNFVAWQNLLFILNQKEQYKEILTLSDSALVYFPGQGLFYMFKGIAAMDQKDYNIAISALNKGLSIPGQNAELVKQFYLSLAESYYRSGNQDEAFRNYDKMLALEPDNVLVLNNYSYYLAVAGKELEKALTMIQKCIEIEPMNPTFLDTYAWVLFKNLLYTRALEPMQKAIDLSTDPSGEVLEHYGDILFMNGRKEEARQIWIKARNAKEVSDKIEEKILNGIR